MEHMGLIMQPSINYDHPCNQLVKPTLLPGLELLVVGGYGADPPVVAQGTAHRRLFIPKSSTNTCDLAIKNG